MNRGTAPSPRPEVLTLTPYVPGRPQEDVAQAHGLTQVIRLAANENPGGPSPRAVAAMAAAAPTAHLYPEASSRTLRAALAARTGLPEEGVFAGNGSDEIIRLLAACYLSAGDLAVVPAQSFPNYRRVALLMGARVMEIPLAAGAMDLMAMARVCQQPARAVFLCRPNNPTGGVFPAAEFATFLATVSPATLVVVDEAYHEYDDTGFDALSYLADYPNLVVTRTFSKAYGLAGLRVGYGLGAAAVWAPLRAAREPFSVNRLASVAALAALADADHLTRTIAACQAGKAYLTDACATLGLDVWPSQGNFVFIDLGRPALPVCAALEQRGVIVRPGDGFGLPTGIRVTVGHATEIQRFVAALSEVMNHPEL